MALSALLVTTALPVLPKIPSKSAQLVHIEGSSVVNPSMIAYLALTAVHRAVKEAQFVCFVDKDLSHLRTSLHATASVHSAPGSIAQTSAFASLDTPFP